VFVLNFAPPYYMLQRGLNWVVVFCGRQRGISHDVRAIIGAWQRHAVGLFSKYVATCSVVMAETLMTGERWLNSIVWYCINERHTFNTALYVRF
jgi:hypothetical protein